MANIERSARTGQDLAASEPAGRHAQGRGATGSQAAPGHPSADGENDLVLRAQADGVGAAAG